MMIDTSDIEKKSLEAHVELCAERYRFLEQKLDDLEENVTETKDLICEVHKVVQQIKEKRSEQLIAWGIGLMGLMITVIGYLITKLMP